MISISASLRCPSRSYSMRWRSPLPLRWGAGVGITDRHPGSHSGMRAGSVIRAKTRSIGTATEPEKVKATGRMGANIRRSRAVEGGEGPENAHRLSPPFAAFHRPTGRGTDVSFEGLLLGAAVSKLSLRSGL